MERITAKMLRGLMGRMARTTGAPTGPVWTKAPNGETRSTVGALVLQEGSRYYGNAWTISEIMNTAGGERVIVRGSTARGLWDAAQAWLDGYDSAAERAAARGAA